MKIDTQRLATALTELWPETASSSRLASWLPASSELALVLDSRQLRQGDLFVAVPGVSVDGRRFVAAALETGAAGVLCDADGLDSAGFDDDRILAVPGLAQRLAALGRRLFSVPEALTLIGVTGTNGKSSVTHYIATLLEALGTSAGVIGTLGYGRPGAIRPALQTTPGPLALQQMLGELANEGVEVVAMEISSHALAQERLGDTRVDVAVFTNLTRDHLDYHGSMAAYAAAKARLFKRESLATQRPARDRRHARERRRARTAADGTLQSRQRAAGDDDALRAGVSIGRPVASSRRAAARAGAHAASAA